MRLTLVPAVLAAAVLFPATSAAAAPAPADLTTSYAYYPDGATAGPVRPGCGPGSRVLGIGAVDGGGDRFVLTLLAPSDDFTAAAVATEFSGAIPTSDLISERVQITCAPAGLFGDVTVVRTADHRVQPGVFSQGLARCPAGSFAIGGGGYFESGVTDVRPAARGVAADTPSADGTAWVFDAVPPANAATQVTLVECAPRTGRDYLAQASRPVSGGVGGATVTCPAGYTAIAGGWYVSVPGGGVAPTGSVHRSQRTTGGAGWDVDGFGPAGTKVGALAQCLR